jgi:hypothetical protein
MDATITGCCACGATLPRIRVRRGKAVQHVAMEHEPDCPAADGPYLAALLRRLGERLEYAAIAVEVEVAA